MRRSDRIAALETEVKWYREESIQQAKVIDRMKEQGKLMREGKLEADMRAAEIQAVLDKTQQKYRVLKAALAQSQIECAQMAQANETKQII